jgi:hypothetical protein
VGALWLWFFLKLAVLIALFIWVRTTPRLRMDQLMDFAWKFSVAAVALILPVVVLWHRLGGWRGWAVGAPILVAAWVLLAGRWRAPEDPPAHRTDTLQLKPWAPSLPPRGADPRGAIAAMSLRNPVHCALCLVATFAGLAGIYLAAPSFWGWRALVYIGAVAILLVS